MSIINNVNRVGNFTSSNAYKLMTTDRSGKGFGAPALEYIETRNMEREMGCSIETEKDAKPLQWGRLCEPLVNDDLPTTHKLCSDETILHPDYDFWADSTDCLIMAGEKKIGTAEIKAPATKKSWFKLTAGENIFSMVDGFSRNGASYSKHTDGAKYLWQCISHACCHGTDLAEFIVFIPYLKDLQRIREAAKFEGINWIAYSIDDELPYINEGGKFKSMTRIQFEVPKSYKDELTERMIAASKLLIPRHSGILLTPQQDGVIIADRL